MKKALIHDILIQNGGAEKCLESFTNIWEDFDIYSLVDYLSKEDRERMLKGKQSKTSFLQNLPFSKKLFRHYFVFYPYAIEQFDFSEYDVIISSSFSVCKGILTRPDQIHIAYVHSPVRYAWDLYHQYLKEANLQKGLKSIPIKWMLHYLRNWDAGTANRPDYYIANSKYVAKRIKKLYNKESLVIYPPVNCSNFTLGHTTADYYFTSSRMVSYKKISLIVEAFSKMPEKKLIVGGNGPEFEKIKKMATSNIEILGFVESNKLLSLMQSAKAFVFAAQEDFGIVPIEAQACGVPVIAYGKGGVLETIVGTFATEQNIKEGDTGVFFEKQTAESLINAVLYFEKNIEKFNKEAIRNQALKFDTKRFEAEIKETIENIIGKHEF
ncbi:glycosyltransferase [Flavobacterium luteum]|uniref:Glycosyltransferase family 4 protein n=1 Tax=Flavobacterium luteum TaxID=2026654 RepID=A0A7J5AHS0_9FLAO|nr:glycosyltransferase [Flavobacterium luteum]KAB1157053.1 glycosyltransferase family 4 protein [Flavobacterium luteum]